jgi:pyrophosphate--fructose-6-phosphate 1-phosphotransferase
VLKANSERWLAVESDADHYRRPGPIRFAGSSEEDRPITLELNALANQGD